MRRFDPGLTPARQALEKALAKKGGARWTKDSRGRNHPTGEEARWFNGLYAQEDRGEIVIEAIEPAFPIQLDGQPLCVVKADARIRVVASGQVRVIDYKGRLGDTEISRLKRKMVAIQHGVVIEWVGKWVERKAAAKAKAKAARDLIRKSEARQRGKR